MLCSHRGRTLGFITLSFVVLAAPALVKLSAPQSSQLEVHYSHGKSSGPQGERALASTAFNQKRDENCVPRTTWVHRCSDKSPDSCKKSHEQVYYHCKKP